MCAIRGIVGGAHSISVKWEGLYSVISKMGGV